MKTSNAVTLALALGFVFSPSGEIFSQQNSAPSTSKYRNAREALTTLRTTSDEAKKQDIYKHFDQVPVVDHDDLMMVYQEARRRQDAVPLISSENTFNDQVSQGQAIASRLKTITDPAFHDDIAVLIEKEIQDLPKNKDIPMVPIGAHIGLGAGARSAIRVVRVESLMAAAGDGKNEKARAALWRMVDAVQDAYFGQLAMVALGKIGNPDDLERVITMIKSNPNIRLSVQGFGAAAIPRIAQEATNPSLSITMQGRFSSELQGIASHDNLAQYFPLLNSPNPFVAHRASIAIEEHMTRSDEALIMKMLKSDSGRQRSIAVTVIDKHAWNEKYVPTLISMLQTKPDVRYEIAVCLGHHRVKSAATALQAALVGADNNTGSEINFALKEISESK